MCEYCVRYGHGNRWYLNPDNFSDDLLKDKGRQRLLNRMGKGAGDYYIDRSVRQVSLAKAPIVGGMFKAAFNRMARGEHAGQVVTLEDALQLVDLARDFVALACRCQRLVGAKEEMCCISFGPIKELIRRKEPEERMEELPLEEVKARLRQYDKKGYFHQALYAKLPYPVVICNCDRKYCTSLKMRFLDGVETALLKGHEICVVDHTRCNGCSGKPQCLRLCQFGSLRWVPTDEVVVCEPQSCFGCGLCRQACPRGALRLVPRESLAPVSKVW
jgi:NAD-dependent dihydropyrimidine dehydrogenase PreA subunit